ncbi:MAG: hypothetical protein KF869_07060 [Phycisphaeraceae bacterium]|nr:hypothetical protein [Phycisphaeraceae bacterium]
MIRRRAFTLLEVMLAAMLGTLVVLSALGLFDIMRRSDIRQAERMALIEEIAFAHRAIGSALTTIVMTDLPMPGNEKDMDDRLRRFERAVDNNDPDPVDDEEPAPRLVLRTEPDGTWMQYESDGRVGRMRAQSLELTVRRPPVLGGRPQDVLFDAAAEARRRAMTPEQRRREAERESRAADRTRREPERDRDRDRDSDRGRSDAPSPRSSANDSDDDDRYALAPGVRGVFELLPDTLQPAGGATFERTRKPRADVGTGLTLWWRELPPVLDPEATEEEIARYRRRMLDFDGRRIPLISGLSWLRWEVYRGDRFDTRTRATWQRELPAYVKVSFETVAGRRENWMFEVAWMNGPEPGTEVASHRGAGSRANRSIDSRLNTGRPPARDNPRGRGGTGTLPTGDGSEGGGK